MLKLMRRKCPRARASCHRPAVCVINLSVSMSGPNYK